MEVSPLRSPTIARSTRVSGVVLPEHQPASAAPVERQAYAELEAPLESAAAPAPKEVLARAAEPTRTVADPSCPEREAWSAIGLANPTPRPGPRGDYRHSAAASGRSERVSR
jgi:hypothetical protein